MWKYTQMKAPVLYISAKHVFLPAFNLYDRILCSTGEH